MPPELRGIMSPELRTLLTHLFLLLRPLKALVVGSCPHFFKFLFGNLLAFELRVG